MGMTVREVSELLRASDADEFAVLERALEADGRKGVRSAVEAARRRLAAEAAQVARIAGLYSFDRLQAGGEGRVLVGLDEVGRGAVAGPLAVGAVVLSDEPQLALLDDSKRLSAGQREQAAAAIRAHARAWAVAYVEPQRIDRAGMAACLREAFALALRKIEDAGVVADVVLVDGNPLGIDARERSIVKGDSKSASIAAASIIAKVERDALMCELNSTFPQYGFPEHKGYGSPEHIQAIREHGLSPVHRASFCRSFFQETLF